jgi:simple sugar transport system ATP-binding protein
MENADAPVLLSVRHVRKQFGGTIALHGIDWDVREGEVHCLIGENGCGKSTLIKVISGVYAPEGGASIAFAGVERGAMTPHMAKSLGIEVIFQDLSLFPNLTVAENIAAEFSVGNVAAWVNRGAIRKRAKEAMARVGADLPLDAPVAALSVSQRQLVAICRGLAANARLLFMDEPTASLTRNEAGVLFEAVRRLVAQRVSIVFVSHRLEEIKEIADRVTVMRDGRKVTTVPASEIDTDRMTELMTGEAIATELKPAASISSAAVLEVRGLSRRGEFDNVNMTIAQGEIVGLIGLLGAGRTELALSLFGMTRPHSGAIVVNGVERNFRSNLDAIAHGVAYVSEDRLNLGLNLRQSIADNVAITVLDRIKNRLGQIPVALRNNLAEKWVKKLGVKASSARAPVLTLSGGNQQRIVLAKWLATAPKLLILDSPTVGVDVRNKQAIYNTVLDLARAGVAVLMISDEVAEVYYNSDRVLHMKEGRIVGEYRPRAVDRNTIAEAVYA